jgi:TldD protein
MKPLPIRVLRFLPFLLAAIASLSLAGTGPAAESLPPAMQAMELELQRSMATLSKADPPAYFISYTISDVTEADVSGSNGALLESSEIHNRVLETQVRVGSYLLDNTHTVGEHREAGSSTPRLITVEDDVPVLRRAIWLATDAQYRSAAEAFIRVKTSKQVQVEMAENQVADFSREQPHVSIGKPVSLAVDRRPWEERVRRYTAAFSQSPAVMNSIATFTARSDTQYQVTTEGTRLAFGQVRYRLELFVQAKAPDGMDIQRFANFDWVNPADAPADAVVMARIHQMVEEVVALQKAPLIEPYVGPAMLSGRAAGVFFHEVLGHRLEGFRQRDITEGQTFARKIGQKIMPDFISVYDDPTMARLGSQVLLGYYPFDDEGVPSERVTLVDHGVLRNFLMSRSPLVGFPHSNGHGRRQIGFQPLSRMGNTIVESSRQVSDAELRRMLIEEVRRQHKPYGLYFTDIEGGFTFTGRSTPQTFQVTPLIVYKIFPDGRPDELVRGVSIVGTPLASLTRIVATGNKEEVFNGFCVAESGAVPVSADAPAILFSELEVAKQETSTDKPPFLPPPLHDPEAKGSRP